MAEHARRTEQVGATEPTRGGAGEPVRTRRPVLIAVVAAVVVIGLVVLLILLVGGGGDAAGGGADTGGFGY